MRFARILSVCFFSLFLRLALADQVVMKNGDRLTGNIEKYDDKNLLIKTDYAGELKLDWSAIQQITSSEPLNVSLSNGQTVKGNVTTTDGNIAVATATGTVTEPLSSVQKLRSENEQSLYEKSLHPGLLEGWQGGANVGFALTGGNSETKNLTLAFVADRKTLHDHWGLYANSVYATNDAPGAVPDTTANAVQAGTRYDRDLTRHVFAFVNADFQTDALQNLDLRSVFGGGLGLHAIKSDHTTLDFLGGLNYTRENYSGATGIDRNLIAATLGEELMHKLGLSTVLTEKLYFFPDFNESGEYRATFNFAAVTKINKWLGWQNAFGDIYVTNPPAGKRQNDILLTTGLNISFTH